MPGVRAADPDTPAPGSTASGRTLVPRARSMFSHQTGVGGAEPHRPTRWTHVQRSLSNCRSHQPRTSSITAQIRGLTPPGSPDRRASQSSLLPVLPFPSDSARFIRPALGRANARLHVCQQWGISRGQSRRRLGVSLPRPNEFRLRRFHHGGESRSRNSATCRRLLGHLSFPVNRSQPCP